MEIQSSLVPCYTPSCTQVVLVHHVPRNLYPSYSGVTPGYGLIVIPFIPHTYPTNSNKRRSRFSVQEMLKYNNEGTRSNKTVQ